jgi:uncharacterized membrane protein YdbT with pleckstrin-like domain
MSYVDEHLLPGERVTYRARRHWLLFAWPVTFLFLAILSVAFLVVLDLWPEGRWILPLIFGLLALIFVVKPAVEYLTSEFAVTDKRVVAKTGLVQRDSHETLLSKIEAIGVDQTLLGRVFNYGTVTIVGTGGTREPFALIADPLEFRRQVQSQIVAHDERGTGRAAPAERVERECPFCAERILAKAKVCRFCGRDVEPVEAA